MRPEMVFRALPPQAAWRHRDGRGGFEVVFPRCAEDGCRIEGVTAAVEDGSAWSVRYCVELDPAWATRRARVCGVGVSGGVERRLEADGGGRWQVDGEDVPELEGCLDVDLESSALTNAFPVHRFGLAVGESADAPAAYVRAADLAVGRLEQRYLRLEDDGGRQRYHYAAPQFGFECRLVYDEHGLVLEYPGIAVRVA